MNKLKKLILTASTIIILVMVGATIIEAFTSTSFVLRSIYGSWWFALLWGVLAISSALYIVRLRVWRMPATFLLHVSFLIILCGAMTTHLTSRDGQLSLTAQRSYNQELPFTLCLQSFEVQTYPGTDTPMDFVSVLTIDNKDTIRVSMNNIGHHHGYRFYQKGYDAHNGTTVLGYTYDPYGIVITYTGYVLLLLSMFAFFFQKGSRFRRLLQGKVGAALLLFGLMLPLSSVKANPQIAPPAVAEEMGTLYILYNGRISLLETFALDVTTKLAGARSYRGRTATEVLCGWMFYADTWKPEPMIKIKGSQVKNILGTESSRVALTDFASRQGDYLLQPFLERIQKGEDVDGKKHILAADEKVNILNSIVTASALKLFPVRGDDGSVAWYSPVDPLPDGLPTEQWVFIRKSLTLLAEHIAMGRQDEARTLITKIHQYQQRELAADEPSSLQVNAERLYNRVSDSRPWAMACITLGILSFVGMILLRAKGAANQGIHALGKSKGSIFLKITRLALPAVVGVLFLYLTLCIVLRTIVSGHLPLSNGFETMQAMAWSCFLMTIVGSCKNRMLLPLGLLVGGFSMLVAMIGQGNPAITNLMPVLNSPLLSVHVMVIMISYALLAFMAFNSLAAIYFHRKGLHGEVASLHRISLLMLYPAVFLLTTGIFIGAVWANVSWGRYWGWDSKEVWALITMLLYAAPLHSSLRWMQRPMHFHAYVLTAFLSVLMTYFGVNFFLPGMHSYA